jgi:hypothetical protein
MIARRASLSSPSRRVVVVRNPDQGMYYTGDGRRPNSLDRTPVYTNGVSVLFMIESFILYQRNILE